MNNFYNLFTRISISEVSFDAKPALGSHPEEAAPQPGTKDPGIKGQSYAAELSENFTNTRLDKLVLQELIRSVLVS
jgi:hypothetical protein